MRATRRSSKRLACLLGLASALPACQTEQVVAPALTATCAANPDSGPAPLRVSFLLDVSGAEGPISVAISYGDGQSGTNPDTPHTYGAAGSYTAAFDVSTATQGARCSAGVSVSQAVPRSVSNKPPDAVFVSDPEPVQSKITGKAPFDVRFDMCASSDPEGDTLYFLFDFEGDGKYDFKGLTGAHCRADKSYAVGTWVPKLCVQDRDADNQAIHDQDVCTSFVVVAEP